VAKKHTFDQSEGSTRIHGPTNMGKPSKLTANHCVPTWDPPGSILDERRCEGKPWGFIRTPSSTKLPLAPLNPIFHVSLTSNLATSVVGDSPKYFPSEPPLGGYIRRRRAPHNTHHKYPRHLHLKMWFSTP
jgi:hypothetical protein